MARRRNNRRASSRRNTGGGSLISKVRFHYLFTATLSGVTGIQTVAVNPTFPGLAEIQDQFDLFCCKKLKYRIHPMDPTDTTNQGAAYYPDVDIQTQTIAQLSESPISTVQTPFCGVPSRWVNVPPSQLKGMLDWYKCSPDAGAAEFESQGIVQIAGGLSDTTRVEFEGVMWFKNPVSSSLQMQRTINRAVKEGLVVRMPPPTTKGLLPDLAKTIKPH